MEATQALIRTKWSLDPSHSHIGFKVKHLMVTNIRGIFRDYNADIFLKDEDFSDAEIGLSIHPASINTGDFARDAHLKSPDFLDTENFKVLEFRRIEFERINKNKYILHGNLNIKDVTKRIKLHVEFNGIVKDPWGVKRAGFVITGKISRKDFGLSWNQALETGGLMVGDEVNIQCEVQLIQQPESEINLYI